MRITLDVDDRILADLQSVTGRSDHAALINEGLRTLLALERTKRELRVGGTAEPPAPKPRQTR